MKETWEFFRQTLPQSRSTGFWDAARLQGWAPLPCSCCVPSPDFWLNKYHSFGVCTDCTVLFIYNPLYKATAICSKQSKQQTGAQECLHVSVNSASSLFLEMREQSSDPSRISENGRENPHHTSLELRLIWPVSLWGTGSACRGSVWLGWGWSSSLYCSQHRPALVLALVRALDEINTNHGLAEPFRRVEYKTYCCSGLSALGQMDIQKWQACLKKPFPRDAAPHPNSASLHSHNTKQWEAAKTFRYELSADAFKQPQLSPTPSSCCTSVLYQWHQQLRQPLRSLQCPCSAPFSSEVPFFSEVP